jgi:hypothetical protein
LFNYVLILISYKISLKLPGEFMAVSSKPTTPTETPNIRDHWRNRKELYNTAKNAVEQRVNFLKASLPFCETLARGYGAYFWEKLSPSTQRYMELVWTKDAGKFVGLETPYEKTPVEEAGDWFLTPYTANLRQKFQTYQTNPVAIGVATTVGALYSLKCIFHPFKTVKGLGRKVAALPRLTYWFAQASIIGLALRGMGRMTNPALMEPRVKKEADSLNK